MSQTGKLCVVTGVTGYIGGRVVPELLAAGHRVRVVARDTGKLRDHPWKDRVEVVRADVGDLAAITEALTGADVAFYLIHAISAGADFEDRDRATAWSFAAAARSAGVRRIIYLGGLSPDDEDLSPHLRSRQEVGEILLASGVPTAVLRAAVIIGSGSASFEMLRHLTERLPAMITPKWVRTRIQPIAVRDVLRYLVGCVDLPPEVNRTFDIGAYDLHPVLPRVVAQLARVPGHNPDAIPGREQLGHQPAADVAGDAGDHAQLARLAHALESSPTSTLPHVHRAAIRGGPHPVATRSATSGCRAANPRSRVTRRSPRARARAARYASVTWRCPTTPDSLTDG